jgi:hypothetical protein
VKWLLLLLISTGALAGVVEPSVLGPSSSTTTNAFSLWGDSTGRSITNSPLLLDTSLMGSGKATLQFTTAAADRTFALPDASGSILVNGSSQSLTSFFLNANTLQWFDNTVTSKRMKFDLSSILTGNTVTLKLQSPTSGTTGTINFPTFSSGASSITLLASGSTITGSSLSGDSVLNWLGWAATLDSSVATDPLQGKLWYSASSDTLKFKREDGSIQFISGFKRTVVDFGSSPLTEKSFTITDSTIALNDGFTPDTTIEAQISRHTSSGKTYVDETDMDSFYVSCTPAAGSLTCLVRCLTGQLTGTFNLDYRLAGTQ